MILEIVLEATTGLYLVRFLGIPGRRANPLVIGVGGPDDVEHLVRRFGLFGRIQMTTTLFELERDGRLFRCATRGEELQYGNRHLTD